MLWWIGKEGREEDAVERDIFREAGERRDNDG